MRRMEKLLSVALIAGLLFNLFGMTTFAEDYTYRVTIDGGNQGVISGTAGLEVKSGSAKVALENGKIVISGLKTDDVVSFHVQSGAISMQDEGKYYIQGIRRSGRDTEELAPSSFRVTEDVDYVVAYGIKGSLVGYTVNFEDENGNELAPSEKYYGNVGDKPVIANVYIEGYAPRALALTKTLSANEAENVFTFVYDEGETEIIEVPGETVTNTVIQYIDRTEGQTEDGEAGTGADGVNEGEDEGGTGGQGAGETGNANAGGAGDEEVGPEGTGENPEELVDLDEEETPLANLDLDKKDVEKGLPLAAGIGIAAAAAAGLFGLLVLYIRWQRNQKRRRR